MNLVSGDTKTKSHASARCAPGPTAAPSTHATVGLSRVQSSVMSALAPTSSWWLIERGSKSGSVTLPSDDPARSAPEQNVPPSPVMKSARTSASPRHARTTSRSALRMDGLRALRACGRLSVMTATPSATSTLSSSVPAITSSPQLTGDRSLLVRREDGDDGDAQTTAPDVVRQGVAALHVDLAVAGLAPQLPPAFGLCR